MPVNKADGAFLRKTGIQYEIVPRSTVDSIQGGEAMSLWLYLITRPQNWVVRKADIKTRFSWGRDKYTKAMTELKSMGLVTVAAVRGDDGRLQGNVIWVHHCVTEVQVNGTSVKPTVRLNSIHKDTDKELKEADIKDMCFDKFWSAYPNKVNKKGAVKSWGRLTKGSQQLAISKLSSFINGLEEFQSGENFRLHASTYLNNERWEDSVSKPTAEARSWR